MRLFLTGISPRLLTAQLIIVLFFRGYIGSFSISDLYLVGLIFLWWPFQEWAAHIFILHAKPKKIGPFQFDNTAAKVHRYHHRNPWILETIFVPPMVICILIPIHVAAWWLITPNWALALTGMFAYTLCSILYEWIHFFAHIPYRPKSKWMTQIQKNRRAHHFKNEHFWHAFTIPAIDKLFGTGPNPKDVPRSGTCKTLGIED